MEMIIPFLVVAVCITAFVTYTRTLAQQTPVPVISHADPHDLSGALNDAVTAGLDFVDTTTTIESLERFLISQPSGMGGTMSRHNAQLIIRIMQQRGLVSVSDGNVTKQ